MQGSVLPHCLAARPGFRAAFRSHEQMLTELFCSFCHRGMDCRNTWSVTLTDLCWLKTSIGSHMIGVHTCFNDITPDHKVSEKRQSALFSCTQNNASSTFTPAPIKRHRLYRRYKNANFIWTTEHNTKPFKLNQHNPFYADK